MNQIHNVRNYKQFFKYDCRVRHRAWTDSANSRFGIRTQPTYFIWIEQLANRDRGFVSQAESSEKISQAESVWWEAENSWRQAGEEVSQGIQCGTEWIRVNPQTSAWILPLRAYSESGKSWKENQQSWKWFVGKKCGVQAGGQKDSWTCQCPADNWRISPSGTKPRSAEKEKMTWMTRFQASENATQCISLAERKNYYWKEKALRNAYRAFPRACGYLFQ